MAYSPKEIQLAKDKIVKLLSEGRSLKSIIEKNKDIPSRPIVYQWLNKVNDNFEEAFFNNYARAREESADLDAETIQEIADKTLKGDYDPQSARVAIEAYKWNASKKNTKKYGDRVQQDITLEDNRSLEEIEIRIKELSRKA